MQRYKIRIKRTPKVTVEHEIAVASDYAAIRHGQRIAAPGETLEVYRAAECIFMSEGLGLAVVGRPALRNRGAAEQSPAIWHRT